MKLKLASIVLALPVAAYGTSFRGSKTNEEVQALEIEGRRELKLTAAQKRQIKRDDRRRKTDPKRTQQQEDDERKRKEIQAWKRGNARVDPYGEEYGARYFPEGREVYRYAKCERTDAGCHYTADYETYERIKRTERARERAQARAQEDAYNYVNDTDLNGTDANVTSDLLYPEAECLEWCLDEYEGEYDLDDCYVLCYDE
jgi:hypothetical protein